MKHQDVALDPELLEILACPACHGRLELQQQRLVCLTCRRRYPIEDGIPILLVEEAELPDEDTP
ncbi:Trm112 family protein [Thermomicrobium sp. 4228-Ro]|uniref:Trm112 family protein n=1 Tax=Thermomicrobium sp. 4228-Ro TaxID=2993937 RepID=UPI002248B6B5|nr:Trm112 family protein [Thermomicrobium sp. 4228-Ro]MCX2726177.1 Trm112 family protein [Thermomicrobium sp. 4228-Ro]